MWYVYTQNLRTDYYYNTYFDMIFLWYSPINCCSHGGLSNPLDILEILLDRVWRMVLPLSQQGNDWVCNDTTPVGHNERLLLANWWYRKKLHFLKWQQRILECPDFLRFRRAKYGSDALEASRKVLLTWWTCGQGLKLLENPALWPGVCVDLLKRSKTCIFHFVDESKHSMRKAWRLRAKQSDNAEWIDESSKVLKKPHCGGRELWKQEGQRKFKPRHIILKLSPTPQWASVSWPHPLHIVHIPQTILLNHIQYNLV